MQLDAQRSIRATLTAVTATLLGSNASSAFGQSKLDSSLLIYSETDRVKTAEGVLDYTRTLSEQRSIGLRLTLDALTGASPNGATPSSQAQTFTGPSGGTSYVAPAGELPLDDTFTDQRLALDGSLVESLDRITFLNVGGHLSFEHDYTSLGVNGGITRDFNRRNTTLGISLSYNHDIVSPIGGAPVPLSSMPPPSSGGDGEGEDEGEGEGGGGAGEGKDVVDVVFGLTQVLDRYTLLRANYSLDRSSGYLSDPYKLLSVVQDHTAAAPASRSDTCTRVGPIRTTSNRCSENCDVTSLAARSICRIATSGTTGESNRTRPMSSCDCPSETDNRSNRTSAGTTSRRPISMPTYLVDGQPLPRYASADSRLAEFDAYTYGFKYSLPVDADSGLRFSAEYYTQKGERGPPDAIGVLRQYDLFPALDVFMVRVGFTHGL